MAQIIDHINASYTAQRTITPSNGVPFNITCKYNPTVTSVNPTMPPFIWDFADPNAIAWTADANNVTNLNTAREVWAAAFQQFGVWNSGYYGREYLKDGVYYPIADTVRDRVLGESLPSMRPEYNGLYCVYHYKGGTTYTDTRFAHKKPDQYESFISPSGYPIPLYLDGYTSNNNMHWKDPDYLSHVYTDEKSSTTYKGYPVYYSATCIVPFETTISGTIKCSFKYSATMSFAEVSAAQARFNDLIDYVEFVPVYNLSFGNYIKSPAGTETWSSSRYPVYYPDEVQVKYSTSTIISNVPFKLSSYHSPIFTVGDNVSEMNYLKYTYKDDTKSYSEYDKNSVWNDFSVAYDTETDRVSVTTLYPLSGWQPPYDISDIFSGGSAFSVPIPFVADDRATDTITSTRDLLRSNYWRTYTVAQSGAVACDVTSNNDGTFTYSYPLGSAEDGWPTEPFTGNLVNSTLLSTMQGSLTYGSVIPASPSDLLKVTVALNDTGKTYTRRPVYTVNSFTIRKGDDVVKNTALVQYRNVDKTVTTNILVTPSDLAVPTANTPGWGYEYVSASHATPSTGTGFMRVGKTAAASTVVADSFEDTEYEGAYVKLNIYRYTGVTYDSKVLVETLEIYFVGEYYDNITPAKKSVYINGVTPTVTVPIDTTPATSEIDTLNAECSNTDVATIVLDDHTLSITQVDAGRCTVRIWSTVYPGSEAFITVLSGSTDPGGADDEPDDYENYPVPTDPEEPLSPEARAQHAYFYDFDWRTSQLKQHCGGFDHGIGRGTTHNAAPGTLYIVYSEHSKREYFRDGVRTNGAEDAVGKYVPIPLLQGDDVWHTDYEAPAFLDTGNIADRSDGANKRFREVQYILALDGDVDMQVAFAFLVDGAMRRPMLKPVAEYDSDNDVITVSTEYDEPYSVAESTVGNLGEWTLDAHTLENAERVRVRQNVTGKGITASTRIVFKMSGQFKLLGVNYVYREMYSR